VYLAVAAYSVVGFLFHLFLVVLVWRTVRDNRAALTDVAEERPVV
jgi:hypothetical protein